jgi:hypothetical protein
MPRIRLDQQGKIDSATSEIIKNLNVKAEDIEDGAITAEKIASKIITSEHIKDQSITVEKLNINDDLDLKLRQLKEVRIENVEELPPAGYEGRIVYNRNEKVLYYDNGNEWIKLNVWNVPYKIIEIFEITDPLNQRSFDLSNKVLPKSESLYLNGLKLLYGYNNEYVITDFNRLDLMNCVELNVGDVLVLEYYSKLVVRYVDAIFERNIFKLSENQHQVVLPYDVSPGTEKVTLNGVSLIRGVDYSLNGRIINLVDDIQIVDEMILCVDYLIS